VHVTAGSVVQWTSERRVAGIGRVDKLLTIRACRCVLRRYERTVEIISSWLPIRYLEKWIFPDASGTSRTHRQTLFALSGFFAGGPQ
jgi:hypothetical protein